ncbi:Polyketide synthase-nonribosomal peptide synthetase [Beauveria bassiana]|nr:Polyketide synthase-nonribosomal peptide synthetase [Beauveria bassiana]
MATQPEPVAIIGSSCRFPGGASSPSKLWDLLQTPRELLSKISKDRFDSDGFYHPNGAHHGSSNVQASYLLEEDPRVFDASFFAINAREAEAMDPQHRILLETVYECMENAGASVQGLQHSQTGVYVGLMTNDYHDIHLRDMGAIPKYSGTGTTRSILSNRVSYFFNWKGPSMTIDTACSSSLVAVHLAVQSLRSGETSVALAAGANLIFGPEMYIIESKLNMLSPNGRSRMWDHNADGYGRGEGVAVVMLKTLSNALRDGDSIECLIRETGVNQDGRTPGITMPSSQSQETLIRDTYLRAGLDLTKKNDRPQFFEAHGTGTSVGDPLEAEAINTAFFKHDAAVTPECDTLYVGSIKTVIGHLEGAAGIAGLIKTSLALQHKIVPPNLHLEQLNPKIVPFTKHMRVPTAAVPWPEVAGSSVRRASVNSFGFGGTNAHAILESFEDGQNKGQACSTPSNLLSPLVFSANSQSSLLAIVKAFVKHLSAPDSEHNMLDLTWTLQSKRAELPYRKAFASSNLQGLLASMGAATKDAEEAKSPVLGTQMLLNSANDKPKILAIFTGQGAQWPTMGAQLLHASKIFAQTIDELQDSLSHLSDGPTWRIRDELTRAEQKSRIHLAEISQPLCTAVQIGLVNLLDSAGVGLFAAVGHSSGEIGAAYAAGAISARDAIRIAYYRGVNAESSAGSGSMMAVGIPFVEAQVLCSESRFAGRLAVAASNGPSTVTISGDSDAILEMKDELDQQKTFARVLEVSKAYHSHHMLPCSELYQKSLERCSIDVESHQTVNWVSSVDTAFDVTDPSAQKMIASSYWIDNMVRPVLFSQAVSKAVADHGPFDIAIEIGPHAALKGPTTQTIKAIANTDIPYHGILKRGTDDVLAFSSALGFIWECLGAKGVQLGQFTKSNSEQTPNFQKNLPTYQWDHDQQYWKESRLSKNFRVPREKVHELLGKQCMDNVEKKDLRWRNFLKVEEIPWLRGHKFQGQILFPAAGHIALAIEASKSLSKDCNVSMIELENVSIGKAITLEEGGAAVEILFTLKLLESTKSCIMAEFACYACQDENSGIMDQCSRGRMTLHLGEASIDTLPNQPDKIPGLVNVDANEFYDSMNEIGLDYTESFRNMTGIARTRRFATSSTDMPAANPDYASGLMVHPILLDICFQTVIAAFCFPGDGSFWTPYLPTNIDRMRVNPFLCNATSRRSVNIEAQIVEENSLHITGNLNVYDSSGNQQIQLDGLTCRSFSKATQATDQLLFSETIWQPAVTLVDGLSLDEGGAVADNFVDLEAVEANERVAYYYLRTLREKFSSAQVASFEWWYQRLFEFADYLLPIVANGAHQSIRAEWVTDTHDTILALVAKFPHQIDLQLVVEVGENLPTYVQGAVPLLEVMLKEDRLTRLYQEGLGVPHVNQELSSFAKSLSHQFPNMKILEIGAGTGGMTREVLREIDGAFGSYTFTDISTGFFESAKTRLRLEGRTKMIFSALDIEKDPCTQGYVEGSYDMIIASNVLHATRSLGQTMAHVRRLLRPGGYLLLNEVTGDMLRLKFIMSGLPGWWLGGDDGRRYSPTISPLQWNETLTLAGFSGVDIIKKDFSDPRKHSLSVIISQAMDEMVGFLREPLAAPYMAPDVGDVYIVGGRTLEVKRLAQAVSNKLRCWSQDVCAVGDITALEASNPAEGFTVVYLDDLDEPVLQALTAEKLKALQFMFCHANNILCLTQGSQGASPYSMALVGLARTMLFEHPSLQMQLIDISTLKDISAHIIAEDLLRLAAARTLDTSYLWTSEPEIAYSRSRKQIQRLITNKDLNDKLNSERRLITESVQTKYWKMVLSRNHNGHLELRKSVPRRTLMACTSEGFSTFDTLLSVRHPVTYPGTPVRYISLGKKADSDTIFAFISSELASAISVPSSSAFAIQSFVDLEAALMTISTHVMSQQFLHDIPSGGSILLHDVDEYFGTVISKAATKKHIKNLFSIFDWRSNSSVAIRVQPTNTKNLFSPDKTYILFGLTGELGRSLADYLIQNGAKYLVLTSRKPPAADAWVQRHLARGLTVKLLSNDITKKTDVQALLKKITDEMPPIAGVVNGAMVLRDKLFTNMTIDDWSAAVLPKIDGSQNLDDCFSTERPLEFFVMLSSLASVIGNSGQSNYNAGNMYCCSLASNRRNRGLAGSAIDIGKIVGIGYVSRNQRAVISLRSHKFQPISEPMFHQMFIQAVISGRPDSGRQSVLSAGMQKRLGLSAEDSSPPLWLGNPRFSHMKWESEQLSSEEDGSAVSSIPIQHILKTAADEADAKKALCIAFTNRLAKILQMSTNSINIQKPLVDVGIDSLIAVEVRSWFLKELNVDVPVLKVIGGASVFDICSDVLAKLSLNYGAESFESSACIESKVLQHNETLEDQETKLPVGSAGEIVDENEALGLEAIFQDLDQHTPESFSTPGTSWGDDEKRSTMLEARVEIIQSAPLSRSQERIWLADCYSNDQTAYNVAFAWRLRGALNVSKFERALQTVIGRHDALHTAFQVDNSTGRPFQAVLKAGQFLFESRYTGPASDIHAEFTNFRRHIFDISTGKTMRASVLQLSGDSNIFMLCYHHIIMDGVSLRTFLCDLDRAYVSPHLQLPTTGYLDYAAEDRDLARREDLSESIAYWKQCFSKPAETLPLLPFARVNSRHPFASADTFTARTFVRKNAVARVKECSQRCHSTPFHVYAAALQVLLFKLLGSSVEDFCFGIADANRLDNKYADTVGFFLNLLPVKLRLQSDETFAQLIKRTRNSVYGALSHSNIPFDALLRKLNVPRSPSHNPLFQVLINYTMGIGQVNKLASCQMEMVEIEDAKTACDLVFSIVETPGQDTAISFTMPRCLYLDEDCSRFINLYVELLGNLCKFPETKLDDHALHQQSETHQNLRVGFGPVVESWSGWQATISSQVELMVDKYPAATAVKVGFSEESISYVELHERAATFAQILADLQVATLTRVAMINEASINAIAIILAVLRLGGTIVPLDPRNPHGRLSAIIQDSCPAVIICDAKMANTATALGREQDIRVVEIDTMANSRTIVKPYLRNMSDPDNTAFILYTSGSTGTPKGVLLNHRGWVSQFAAVTQQYGLKQEVVLQQSSPGFDMTVEQVFIALCNGGKVVLVPSSVRANPIEVSRLILLEEITYSMAVPSEYSAMLHLGADFLRHCSRWKYVFCGGEKITDHLRQAFHALNVPGLQLFNVYGPTEITVSCCRGLIPLDMTKREENHNFCTVGQVLPNYQVYIVGSDGKAVATGFPGEIYIGGIGVGNGYLNNSALTQAKFLPNTFNSDPSYGSVYRTGDRGRLLNDGSLVFLGRLEGDSQIKLRGQRVELDEIANVLLQTSTGTLASAVVDARG